MKLPRPRVSAFPLLIYFCLFTFAVSNCASADINVAKIFSDHMVMQHSSSVQVRGTSEPADRMVVNFAGQTVNTIADDKGSWWVEINTPGPGGPYDLVISVDDGEPKVVISDVMVGEVWLCAGERNMESSVGQSLNGNTEIEQSKSFPNIRLFTVEHSTSPEVMTEFEKVKMWSCCSPEAVGSFSATAYFFGRELSKKLDMPVGLIHSSWQGTRTEAWANRSALDEYSELAPLLRHWDESPEELDANLPPGNLYNSMIAPLKGFPVRGVIWYGGEANVGRGHQYHTLFPALIKNWRDELAGGTRIPFYFVQLAPYRYNGQAPEDLPELRDAQRKTFESVENTGMVVSTDIGDIRDKCPQNKQEIGRRLALWALAETYDDVLPDDKKEPVRCGPNYHSLSISEGKIRLLFNDLGSGLTARESETLSNFTICGADENFVPANAMIDGDTVIVSSADVPEPVAVRFAWDDCAEPNFFNMEGLPASPFRTDEFELLSNGVDY